MKPALVVLLLAFPLAAAAAPTVSSPCNDWLPSGSGVDTSCPAPIHPGAQMANGCTLNWVLTDGTDLYVGTAGHCASFASPDLYVTGVAGSVGTLVYRGQDAGKLGNDSAFFRIDAPRRGLVDGALAQWGGPRGVATPVPGEPLVQYGWGVATKDHAQLRGREGVTVYAYPTDHQVIFLTEGVSGGDSGSPIMTADGEAVGHTVATIFPGAVTDLACGTAGDPPPCPLPWVVPVGNVAFGVSLATEMQALGHHLGKTMTLVTGRAMLG